MHNFNIKQVTADDLLDLQLVSRETFFESYAAFNSQENMQLYLEESFSLDKLRNELANKDSMFFFAMQGKNLTGYMKLNFKDAQGNLKGDDSMEIERLYTRKPYQGEGVGQALYNHAFKIVKDLKLKFLWLGVWQKNKTAQSFYRKNGFSSFDIQTFKLGKEVQTDIMMKLDVENSPLETISTQYAAH